MQNHQYIKNQLNDEATMLLYSEIGVDGVNGQMFANEMLWLERNGCKKVNIHINSPGGNVLEGYSIYASIKNSTMEICMYNDGVCASIAGVLYLSVPIENRYMKSHALFMMHPVSGGDIETQNVFGQSIATIISENTNMTIDDVCEKMKRDTWMDSSMCIEYGITSKNNIEVTKKKLKVKNLDCEKVWALANKLLTKKEETMDVLKNFLELGDDAVELDILNSFKAKLDEQTTVIDSLKQEKMALENRIQEIHTAQENKEKDALINEAVGLKKITNESAEKLRSLSTSDLKSVLDSLVVPSNHIPPIQLKNDELIPENRKDWTIRDWDVNDNKGYLKLMNEAPALFDKMFKDCYGVDFKR